MTTSEHEEREMPELILGLFFPAANVQLGQTERFKPFVDLVSPYSHEKHKLTQVRTNGVRRQ
jgi:hypothetical protein